MNENFFAYISRMRFIKRWALMRNSYDENIQEHSHMVAVLAHALAVIRNQYFDGHVDAGEVAVAALYHDASEILTGDLPTPIKYYNDEIRDAYKVVEAVAEDRLLSMLPEELEEAFRPALKITDPDTAQLVKAADRLSAYIKCVEERKAGNNEFHAAADQIYAELQKSPLPELQYFMEHFLPPFELTLDELNEEKQKGDLKV